MKKILEICCSNLEACKHAQAGGADRIELCGSMAAGGLTPSLGLFQEVLKHCTIPIAVMIRPRGAGFCYKQEDLEVMKKDALYVLEHGASAIVFGCLKNDRTVDIKVVKELCEIAHTYGKEAVFHRAIDECKDLPKQIEKLYEAGIDRVLTAGGPLHATAQLSVIKKIKQEMNPNMELIICGNIRSHNVVDIMEETGVRQIHSACRVMIQDESMKKEEILNYANAYDSVDISEVKNMVNAMCKVR